MEFEGKVALVTGAGSGIGKATALRLAAAGARVGVLSLAAPEVEATIAEIAGTGGKALGLTADVADEAAMEAAVEKLVSEYGRIDILVANAGINGVWAPIDDLTPQEWDTTIRVNLRGTYLTLHFAVPHIRRAGGGSIVIVSSINGSRTFSTAGATAYSATKAAQVAIAQQLAVELGRQGIRVNAILPGSISTSIGQSTVRRNADSVRFPVEFPEGTIPLSRENAGKSEDVADVIAFLASDAARHVTGMPVYVDGGQSLVR